MIGSRPSASAPEGEDMQEAAVRQATSADSFPCRTVIADEGAHYHEFGWVKLKGFLHLDMVKTLLETAIAQMGEDGDSNPPYGISNPYFNPYAAGGLGIPPMR